MSTHNWLYGADTSGLVSCDALGQLLDCMTSVPPHNFFSNSNKKTLTLKMIDWMSLSALDAQGRYTMPPTFCILLSRNHVFYRPIGTRWGMLSISHIRLHFPASFFFYSIKVRYSVKYIPFNCFYLS